MPIKRLLDAVIFGAGAAAGADLYEDVKKNVEKELDEIERDDAANKAKSAADATKLLAQKKIDERERALKKKRHEEEVESELAAMKKRLAKESPKR